MYMDTELPATGGNRFRGPNPQDKGKSAISDWRENESIIVWRQFLRRLHTYR